MLSSSCSQPIGRLVTTIALALLLAVPAAAQAPVVYRVSFPAPEHHYAQVEVTFSGVPAGPLEARMSRSSPGRYAVHEFGKHVFDLHAYDSMGRALLPSRPNPYQWDVAQAGLRFDGLDLEWADRYRAMRELY